MNYGSKILDAIEVKAEKNSNFYEIGNVSEYQKLWNFYWAFFASRELHSQLRWFITVCLANQNYCCTSSSNEIKGNQQQELPWAQKYWTRKITIPYTSCSCEANFTLSFFRVIINILCIRWPVDDAWHALYSPYVIN